MDEGHGYNRHDETNTEGGSDKPVLFASSRHTVAELIEYHNSKVLS